MPTSPTPPSATARVVAVRVVAATVVDGQPVLGAGGVVRRTILTLRLDGAPPDGAVLRLRGDRQVLAGNLRRDGTGWLLEVPLACRRPWSAGTGGPLPGRYHLELVGPAGRPVRVPSTGDLALERAESPASPAPETGVQLLDPEDGHLAVLLAPYRPTGVAYPDVEAAQGPLRRAYRHSTAPISPDLVLASSFDGRSVGDNTAPIVAELTRRRPELQVVWALAHHAVAVPAGDRSVLLWTRAWWELLARARYVITNTWLPSGFVRRPGQVVLQAWHGTPFKQLGLDRLTGERLQRRLVSMPRSTSVWDLLIAQNAYSAEIFRRTYAYPGSLPVTGYPRNDRLALTTPARRDALRARLGLAPGERVVLYAPTFRDNHKGLFDDLDFGRLLDALAPVCPDGVRLLVRGHVNTISWDRSVRRSGVLDVTLYPDLAELFAVAEVLITDYSSAMFDYAVTGCPLVFHVPDLDAYRDEIRGTYFDLAETAPGPLTRSTDATAAAVAAALTGDTSEFTDRYAAWRDTYVPLDDGGATDRVVDALLAGWNG